MLLRPDMGGGREGVIMRRKRNASEAVRPIKGWLPSKERGTALDALSGFMLDTLEPHVKGALGAFGGAVHGLSSAFGTSSVTGGTTDPRVAMFLGDTSTLGERLTSAALEAIPATEKARAERRAEWAAPATGSTYALAASDYLPDPLPPGAGHAAIGIGSIIGRRSLEGLGHAPIIREVFEKAAKKQGAKKIPENAAKLEALGDEGVLSREAVDPFVRDTTYAPNTGVIGNLLETISIGGHRVGDVKVLPPMPTSTEPITHSTREPVVRRVDVLPESVDRNTGKTVRTGRMAIILPDGSISSVGNAVLGGTPLPGYAGTPHMGGAPLERLVMENPETLAGVARNYRDVTRTVATQFGPRGLNPMADAFYQTTERLSRDMAAHFEGRTLPNGEAITPEFINDLGGFLSSGTEPLLQIPQQKILIDVATSNPIVRKTIVAAQKELDKANAEGFSSLSQAEKFRAAWAKKYFGRKTPANEIIMDAFKEGKVGTSRASGNIYSALSGGAKAVKDGDKIVIKGGFGTPRATWMTEDTVSKTGVYAPVMGDATLTHVTHPSGAKTPAIVSDVHDAITGAGVVEYDPLTGEPYRRFVRAAEEGYNNAAMEMAARWKAQGLSDEEIAKRLAAKSNYQQVMWGAGRSEINPAIIDPLVGLFKWAK